MLIGFINTRFNNALVRTMVVILTCLWFGGIVHHYCLDGMEPDITLHFENLNGHVELGHADHGEESGHIDFEKEALTDNLLPKSYEHGIQLFSLALLIIALLQPVTGQRYQWQQSWLSTPSYTLRPPLRAPPAYS